jgi:hypothetical protein
MVLFSKMVPLGSVPFGTLFFSFLLETRSLWSLAGLPGRVKQYPDGLRCQDIVLLGANGNLFIGLSYTFPLPRLRAC